MKRVIAICMGSSCYARKNTVLVDLIREFLDEHQLTESVSLIGSLCMEQCKKGPNIKIDGTIYTEIDSVKLIKILTEELL